LPIHKIYSKIIQPMNPLVPSDTELEALALQVDRQLSDLQSQPAGDVDVRGSTPGTRSRLPAAPKQQAVIEQATGEPFESFWDKFKRHARRDLCLPEGHLYKQWKKWRDLRSKDSVKVAVGVIAGMGIPTASIGPVAVAASVFLLNAVANIGIEAVCEGCAEEEAARTNAPKAAAKEKDQKP
jgi:hypothetical protein